jgi:anti-sigma factor RsiW
MRCTKKEPKPVQCDEVTALLPALVDGEPVEVEVERHLQTCLRCQAELARYRRLLRTLALLRTRYIEPTPGLLGDTLAALTDAAEHGARHTLLSGRRIAYAGAIGGGALAAGATAALLIARSRRRATLRLAG